MRALLHGRLQSRRNCWGGQPAFGELEPYAGELARSVLRGAGYRRRPTAYSTRPKRGAMKSQVRREQVELKDLIPDSWLHNGKLPRLRLRCFQMGCATLDTFRGRSPRIETDRAVIICLYGEVPYLAPPAVEFQFSVNLQFRMDSSGMRRQLPEGAYTLIIVPEMEGEYGSRLALEFTSGLLASVMGRNMVYRLMFDNTVDLVADTTTIIGETHRNPEVDEPPDFSRQNLRALTSASRGFIDLKGAERNRVELALHWHAEAIASAAPDQFLKHWIALEALGMSERENIRPLNISLADAYGISLKEVQDRFGVGRIFGFRSKIVHRGERLPVHGVLDRYVEALFRDILFQKLGIESRAYASKVANEDGFDFRKLLHE